MKIAVVRGAFLNQFEMQSFLPLAKKHQLVAFSSLKPIHSTIGLPVIKLPSPMDLLQIASGIKSVEVKRKTERVLRGVINRFLIDGHYLFNLEKKLQGFDIVHSAETYFYYTQQCLNAKRKGWVKKVVCSVSETIPFNNEGIRGRREFKKRAIEKVDFFLARTNLAKKALIKEGCNPNKVIVIPHGVDLKKFKIKSEKLKIIRKKEKINILFGGRLEEEKGIKELLKVFKELTSNNKQLAIKLKIVGEGSLKEWIKQWIKKNKQDENITIDQYAYYRMPKVYQEADIFVLPSKKTKTWQEHFGMVLIEAMASSLPIIATSSGAIPEVLGKCGLLVEEENPAQLYQALKRLATDESLRLKLGKMGRVRTEKYYDSLKVAEKIEKVYEKVIAGTKASFRN